MQFSLLKYKYDHLVAIFMKFGVFTITTNIIFGVFTITINMRFGIFTFATKGTIWTQYFCSFHYCRLGMAIWMQYFSNSHNGSACSAVFWCAHFKVWLIKVFVVHSVCLLVTLTTSHCVCAGMQESQWTRDSVDCGKVLGTL